MLSHTHSENEIVEKKHSKPIYEQVTVHSSHVIEKALIIDNSEEEEEEKEGGEEEHNMNYIRSRFLNKDRNVQRANPFNDADYALRSVIQDAYNDIKIQ